MDISIGATKARGEGAFEVRLEEWVGALAVAVAYLLLFGPTLSDLLRDWWGSGEYGHGFLLLPVALYLGWKARRTTADPARALGTALLLGSVVLFLLGTVAAEYFTRRVASLGAAAGLALYYRGWEQLKAWWLPFSLMLFTIPLPEVVLNSLTLPLQLMASRVAVAMLEFRHVPAALSGNIILLPGQELFVAEACSGLRSVSAILGLTLLIAGTALRRPISRVVLLLVAVPSALAANALRVFGTGFASYYMGPEVAEGLLHTAAGLAVFAVALALVGLAALALRGMERWASA